MSFKQGLIYARSHIIFTLGLVLAFGVVIKLEQWKVHAAPAKQTAITLDYADVPLAKPSPLDTQEMLWARIAWRYFENNYQESTGFVNSVDDYAAATLWDTASYMMGLISAHRLRIVDKAEFNERVSKLLETLAGLTLFDGALPNKSYNTVSLEMTNYQNEVTVRGIGWSAIDIARLMVPMNILVWNYPQHAPQVKALLGTWQFDKMIKDGVMYGATLDEEDKTEIVQEGRVGYEEYAAKSLVLMGIDAFEALEYFDFAQLIDVYSLKVLVDAREPEFFGAHNYIVSEPYVLDGLEYGWDETSRQLAWRVFRAQEERYEDTGILTAVSEDNIDQAPWFVYNTVYTSGKQWNAITDAGEDASEFKTISTKAAIGWHVLFDNDYTNKLIEAVEDLYDEEKGWYSGRYENSGEPNKSITANTNAIILEALAFKKFGKLVQAYPGS